MKYAYYESVTRKNIIASFRRSIIWPVDASRHICVPRPRDADVIGTIVSTETMVQMLEKKREAFRREIMGGEVNVQRCGYTDTNRGAVLTSDVNMANAYANARQTAAKRQQKELAQARKDVAAAQRKARQDEENMRLNAARLARQAAAAVRGVVAFKKTLRTMRELRAQARLLTKFRNATPPRLRTEASAAAGRFILRLELKHSGMRGGGAKVGCAEGGGGVSGGSRRGGGGAEGREKYIGLSGAAGGGLVGQTCGCAGGKTGGGAH